MPSPKTSCCRREIPCGNRSNCPRGAPAVSNFTLTEMLRSIAAPADLRAFGKTNDSAERKRLLEQHRKIMHEEILAMRHMKCPMMGSSWGKEVR